MRDRRRSRRVHSDRAPVLIGAAPGVATTPPDPPPPPPVPGDFILDESLLDGPDLLT